MRSEPADGDLGTVRTGLVQGMRDDLPALADDLARYCQERLAELPRDREATEALVASAAGYLATVLELLEPAGDVSRGDADPGAATAYTELMARRGVSAEAVMQANRLGLTWFWEVWRERIAATPSAAAHRAELLEAGLEPVIAYSEAAVARISTPHATERGRWLRSPAAIRAEEVRRLLAGDPEDPGAASSRLGYRLDGTHTAIVAWPAADPDGLDPAGALDELLDRGGAGALVVAGDPGEAWAWIPRSGAADAAGGPSPRAVERAGLRIAIGSEATGAAGFRRTHRDAREAARIARQRGGADPVTRFDDVATLALLTIDRERAQALAATVLGALAEDDDRARGLRLALLAYLDAGSSFAGAGRALGVHENTIAYRVRQAEELLGRPVDRRRYDLHTALLIAELEASEGPAAHARLR